MPSISSCLPQRGNWLSKVHAIAKDQCLKAMVSTRMWLSSLSQGDIVNPCYFEVLAAGTTMLLCNSELGFRHLHNMLMFVTLEDILNLNFTIKSLKEESGGERREMVGQDGG